MSSPLASPRGGESTARVPIKFGMCNTRLEVIFYRTRRMELVVQVGATCGSILDRLRKVLYLEASVDFRVWVDDVVMDHGCVLPPMCRTITVRPAPGVLLVSLVDAESSHVSSSVELLVDLSGVPRDMLPLLRPLLGAQREPLLLQSPAGSSGGSGQWINMSCPFARQGVAARSTLVLVPVSAFFRRVLSGFSKPSFSGWLLKKSNVLTHRRYCILSDRCLIYFKSDAPSSPVKGLVPLDYYGVATFPDDPCRFRLTNPLTSLGVPLKTEYDFESDDGSVGWVEAVLAVKAFPQVFGVPWHWNPARVEGALELIAESTIAMQGHLLPNLFVQDGLAGEVMWLEELLDGSLPFEKVKQVMLGCNPRSVVSLFKRYMNFLPSPMIPASLSLALFNAIRKQEASVSDEALAASLVLILRQVDPDQKPQLVKSFQILLSQMLTFMHTLWTNSKLNGCTSVLLGRCFGHSLVQGIESLSDCAVIGSTLCRLSPLLKRGLIESNVPPIKVDGGAEKSLRWRCTVQVAHFTNEEQQLQFFQFPDVSNTEDSTLIEDDLETTVQQNKEQEAEVDALLKMAPAAEVKPPKSELELRLAALEDKFLQEQKTKLALEARIVALEAKVAQLQDEVVHGTQPKSPTTTSQSLMQIAIGRQRGKSGSGAASDADTPELPPRNPRLGATRTTGHK